MHPKVLEALTATRALGIPDEEVKPVLKRLLNLYDKKWELIEEDSYRTLIDAYFDRKDDKETGNRRRTSPGKDNFERPPKRQQSQSEKLNSKVQAVSSEDDTVSTSSKEIEVLEPLSTDANSSSLHSDKKKEHVSSPLMVVKTEKIPQGVPSSILLENLMGEKGSSQKRGEDGPSNHQSRQLIVPKTERMENSPHFSEPKKVGSSVCPAPSENSSHGDCLVKSVASSYRDMKKRDYSAMNGDCSSSKGNIDVASSSLGEVKMSLNCNSALRQRNFQIPKLDAVLKFVEENYLKAYNVEPRFSVARLLKDLCQAFLKLGSNCHGKSSSSKSDTQCATKVSGAMVGPNKRQLQIGDSEGQMISKSTGSAHNGLVVAERRSKPCEKKKYAQNVADITKGAENVKIALVHDTSVENLPSFNYIPHNIIYQNAHVQFSLARISDEDCCPSCSGNCLSSTLPCICASETGGEFAYTAKGQLKEEFLEACISRKTNPEKQHFFYCHDCPEERTKNEYMPEKCKGHLLRKFIKECWRKCGCDMQCGNRVVQRGITCKLQVFWTRDGKGWGVRTVEDLPKGTFVCEYIGEIVTNIELYNRNMQSDGNERHTYPVTLDADWGSEGILQDEDALCLDATYHGNVARFINHRCFDANLIDIPVEIETPDRHYYHLAFFTTRKVSAFEELTWDYAIDFDDHDHPVKAFQCCCRSQYCRDKNRRDTRRP